MQFRGSLDGVKILFRLWVGGWMGGKIIPIIRLTSAKDLVEVEAGLGNKNLQMTKINKNSIFLVI